MTLLDTLDKEDKNNIPISTYNIEQLKDKKNNLKRILNYLKVQVKINIIEQIEMLLLCVNLLII